MAPRDRIVSYTALHELLEEISASFATLDEDAPVTQLARCPKCGTRVVLKQDQIERVWEVSCCGHEEVHRSRAKVLDLWNEWAAPWELRPE